MSVRAADESLLDLVRQAHATAKPYAIYRRLRDEAPVLPDGENTWIVSRYEDVLTILSDTERYSSSERVREAQVSPSIWEAFGGFSGFFWSDPPAYDSYRDTWTRAFKPRLKGIPVIVQSVVDEFLDALPDDEPFDAVARLAFPLPAIVILELLGVPREDRDMFRRVSGNLIDGGEPSAAAIDESAAWLHAFLHDRQNNPRDDILSDLVSLKPPIDDIDPVTLRREIVDIVHFLLAGHETTTSAISSGLNELVRRPDDRRFFAESKSFRPRAVEEILRFESPLQIIERRANAATEVAGTRIEHDATIRLLLGSANHDERQFELPDEFLATRFPNPHLAFGSGVHLCLGAPLARIEIPIALASLLTRFPKVQPACDPADVVWRTNSGFHGIVELPLTVG